MNGGGLTDRTHERPRDGDREQQHHHGGGDHRSPRGPHHRRQRLFVHRPCDGSRTRERRERIGQRRRGREPRFGLLLETSHHHRGEHRRNPLAADRERRQRGRRRLGDVQHQLAKVVRDERLHAREQFVEHQPHRVDIDACIGRLTHRLLRRHVFGRAHHDAGLGADQLQVTDGLEQLRHPEIEHLHEVGHAGPGGQEDVFRLHVAMHHAHFVSRMERARQLLAEARDALEGEGALVDRLGERSALEHLHHAVHTAPAIGQRLVTEVPHLHDVLIGDGVDRAHLLREAVHELGLEQVFLLEHLDRCLRAIAGVGGEIDLRHRAFAEHLLDLPRRERVPLELRFHHLDFDDRVLARDGARLGAGLERLERLAQRRGGDLVGDRALKRRLEGAGISRARARRQQHVREVLHVAFGGGGRRRETGERGIEHRRRTGEHVCRAHLAQEESRVVQDGQCVGDLDAERDERLHGLTRAAMKRGPGDQREHRRGPAVVEHHAAAHHAQRGVAELSERVEPREERRRVDREAFLHHAQLDLDPVDLAAAALRAGVAREQLTDLD